MKNVALALITSVIFTSSSLCAVKSVATKDERIKMADLHNQMAVCLGSEKSVSDCQLEMEKSCQDIMGKAKCTMMGAGPKLKMHKAMKAENKIKNKNKGTM